MPNVNHLRDRAELLRHTRQFFDQRGFLEIQPPCLSRDCVVDAFLDPIQVESLQLALADERIPERFYLQTSPESAMKRMIAAGAPSIYSLGPVFRSGESGSLHNVEFTMLEWYEVGGDFASAVELTGQFVSGVLSTQRCDVVSYRNAFQNMLGFDPIDASIDILRDAVAKHEPTLSGSLVSDRDEMLDILLSSAIAPNLGWHRPTILTDYPLSQAALAKRSQNDPDCAARFELFANGIEIANGYDELLDADVLRQRYRDNNRKRVASGRQTLDTETTLLDAMCKGLPPCSGVALGIDRLLMLKVNAAEIGEIMPFSIFEA